MISNYDNKMCYILAILVNMMTNHYTNLEKSSNIYARDYASNKKN